MLTKIFSSALVLFISASNVSSADALRSVHDQQRLLQSQIKDLDKVIVYQLNLLKLAQTDPYAAAEARRTQAECRENLGAAPLCDILFTSYYSEGE